VTDWSDDPLHTPNPPRPWWLDALLAISVASASFFSVLAVLTVT
jgi:hypothetical protein